MEGKQPSSPVPSSSSSLLRDISNFRTPKHTPQTRKFQSPCPQFFTAARETPRSSSTIRRRPSLAPSASSAARLKAARRFKAFELEQSKSARKAQMDKEKSMRSLAKSLTVWLNFLFQNPNSCGCDVSKFTSQEGSRESKVNSALANGKRESLQGSGVGVEASWRCPKRMRGSAWRGVAEEDSVLSSSMHSALQASLQDVCSFDDLKERMLVYLSLASCKEIFNVMTQVTKNIDEGRLKMKAHCPIVTDVGLKEKALRILMSYNPIWLRIGLYIIFGGDSLLPEGDANSEQEIAFLKMVIEKQFFSHAGLARVYAYNKLVEGLYRPGYYEILGNVILKRFLLLVLILDRAKSQSFLPIKYGIDGLDGGSPLLFTLHSSIKSSRQMILDFLPSDVMHGEGNLLAHLTMVGYKVSYLQSPLSEYDFRVTDLFEDLRDGVRLCRAIQLLQHDTSILTKVVIPSDTHKKNMINCGVGMKYLKQAGMKLSDADGSMIVEDDIVSGDKELTLSLLWNMFVHLQLPLLIDKKLLSEEIARIQGVNEELNSPTLLDLLLTWIQAICENYGFRVADFAFLVDGRAMWCLLDYYFRKELNCACSLKDVRESRGGTSIMSVSEYEDAVHNFVLSQKLTALLGNFPEVLQVSDILEHNGACNSQSVIILLVFLAFQLIVRKNTDQLNFHKLLGFSCQNLERKRLIMEQGLVHPEAIQNQERRCSSTEDGRRNFKAIMAWWQEMAMRNNVYAPRFKCLTSSRQSSFNQSEKAARIIQSHFRRFMIHNKYLHFRKAVSFLQLAIRAWLHVKKKSATTNHTFPEYPFERLKQLDVLGRYQSVMVDRHNFINLKRSAAIIQQAVRTWTSQKYNEGSMINPEMCSPDIVNAAAAVQNSIYGWTARSKCCPRTSRLKNVSFECEKNEFNDSQAKAATKIQFAWRNFIAHKILSCHHLAAGRIQSCYRGWIMRRKFASQKQAAIKIQSAFRCMRCSRDLKEHRNATRAAIVIQSQARGWIARRIACQMKCLIIMIQSHCRGWLVRKEISVLREAVIKIQSAYRSVKCLKVFQCHLSAALDIQCFIRGQIARRRLLGSSCCHKAVPVGSIFKSGQHFQSFELGMLLSVVLKLQRWWRRVLQQKTKKKSAILIQSHIRGWIARQEAIRERHHILMHKSMEISAILIQSHIRGWIARREAIKERHRILMNKSTIKSTILIQSHVRGWIARREANRERHCVLMHKLTTKSAILIQSYVRGWIARQEATRERHRVLMHKSKIRSAILIQSHVRGWIARRKAIRERHRITVIQSYWKGYLARKDSKGLLLDLRLRVQKSAANVDDGMRIINRLVAALSELLSMKSVSGILHTCATLDMATAHSQKCCEKLVEAGAIKTLLKLIRSVSRSIPDQEVLKHALSTLRNLARYSHLTEVLASSHGSVETILWELLRNKEDGYHIAAELLKKICSNQKGVEAVRNSPALLKRLNNLVEDLRRKAANEKRNPRSQVARDQTEKRLRAAVELLNLIMYS